MRIFLSSPGAAENIPSRTGGNKQGSKLPRNSDTFLLAHGRGRHGIPHRNERKDFREIKPPLQENEREYSFPHPGDQASKNFTTLSCTRADGMAFHTGTKEQKLHTTNESPSLTQSKSICTSTARHRHRHNARNVIDTTLFCLPRNQAFKCWRVKNQIEWNRRPGRCSLLFYKMLLCYEIAISYQRMNVILSISMNHANRIVWFWFGE